MSEIFISYARPSEATAADITEKLRAIGHKVWRDSELPAHRSYSEVIEERLLSADAVVVLWCNDAIRSQWVRAEADIARQRGNLVQVSLDSSVPPIPFNQIQCADFVGWSGDDDHAGWKKMVDSISMLTGPTEQSGSDPSARGDAETVRILVLPFTNMSDEAEQEYFSDGITEDVITDLSKVSALDVVARNRAFSFKGRTVDAGSLLKQLGVTHFVEGSVRRAVGRVRISAQLIDTRHESQVWAERYDRELDDIFAIQDEISKAVVVALKLKLLPTEKKAIESRGTASVDAYNLYLMARQQWISGNGQDRRTLEIAERMCQRAVALDPLYARAWGLMALAQARLQVTFSQHFSAEETADKALALDRDNVEALCSKALTLGAQGHHDEALPYLAQALEIDPNSIEANKEAARSAYLQKDLERAISYYEKLINFSPTDYHSAGILISCYRALGEREQMKRVAKICVERCEKVVEEDATNGPALSIGILALIVTGDPQRANEWLERALLVDPDNLYMRYNLSCALASEMNDPEKALEVLEPVLKGVGEDLIRYCESDPDLDSLRTLPRFNELLREAKTRTHPASDT